MLPPFIIEQIRQREERERSRREDERRPRVELPVAPAGPIKRRVDEEEPDPDRGVIIVDLGG